MVLGVGPTCYTDSRYPERLQNGVYFIPIPQRGQEKACIVDQTMWQPRILTDFKRVTFCMFFLSFEYIPP